MTPKRDLSLNEQVVKFIKQLRPAKAMPTDKQTEARTKMQAWLEESCREVMKRVIDLNDEQIISKLTGALDRIVPENGRSENPYQQFMSTAYNLRLKKQFLASLEVQKKALQKKSVRPR